MLTNNDVLDSPSRNRMPADLRPDDDSDLREMFQNMEVIFAYSRADALADGVLVDVSGMAKEAGFTVPVAVTANLWADIQTFPEGSGEDGTGRLWDVLCIGRIAIGQAMAKNGGNSSELLYNLLLSREGLSSIYTLKSVIGPGDQGEPVLTLMRPDED